MYCAILHKIHNIQRAINKFMKGKPGFEVMFIA